MNRQDLIKALAVYLTTNIGRKAWECHEGKADGLAWARVFGGLALKFDCSAAEAEAAIKAVLDAEAVYPAMVEGDGFGEVNELMARTNASKMDCMRALSASDGDFTRAIEIIRSRGQAV